MSFWPAPTDSGPDLFMSYSQINPADPAIDFFQRAVRLVRHFACQEIREQRQAQCEYLAPIGAEEGIKDALGTPHPAYVSAEDRIAVFKGIGEAVISRYFKSTA